MRDAFTPERAKFRLLPSGNLLLSARPEATVGGEYVEYVRADLYDELRAERDRLIDLRHQAVLRDKVL